MSRFRTTVSPRVAATAVFGVSLLVFGAAAATWHPAVADLDLGRTLEDLQREAAPAPAAAEDTAAADEFAQTEVEAAPEVLEPAWVDHEVGQGETIGGLLPRYGMPLRAVRAAALPYHDIAKLKAGEVLSFLVDPADVKATAFKMALSADRTLIVQREQSAGEGVDGAAVEEIWTAHVDEIIYERRTGVREFVVESTLWGAAVTAGLRPADIVGLADVYRFDLDFNTEVRAGARARMVVEELWLNGEFVRLGAPLAARFENDGKEYVAIRYQDGDKPPAYYDALGRARKKPFLRSPLKFSRVTSGFNTNRYHPVLKRRRPHNGVDFGAPTGTPVYAVGNGRVEVARVSGGHGRFVKLDHSGPYASSYSHLSRISVREGQTVKQGQIVGYVGSSGLATGPHLHYQFWVGGKYVNPLTVKLPNDSAEDVRDTAAFQAWRKELLAQLDNGSVSEDLMSPALADAN